MARIKKFKNVFGEDYNWKMAVEDGLLVDLTGYKENHSHIVKSSIIFPVSVTRDVWEQFIRPSDDLKRTNTINYILEAASFLLNQNIVRGEFITRVDMKSLKIRTVKLYVNTMPGGFKYPNVIVIMLPEET
jgi:hypothetical protein